VRIYNRAAKANLVVVTIIEIRPFRNGWQVYEATGVEPVFPEKRQAIRLR
jgi:hypothetical protein